MKRIPAIIALLVSGSLAAVAQTPPSKAPTYRPDVSLQPVVIYDSSGNIVSSFGGSASSITRSAAVVTLPANTATQVASAGLKSFFAQVQGSNPVIIGYDNTVCSGTGTTLAAASGTSPGQSTLESPASTTAYWACSVAGSSVAVVRGQ